MSVGFNIPSLKPTEAIASQIYGLPIGTHKRDLYLTSSSRATTTYMNSLTFQIRQMGFPNYHNSRNTNGSTQGLPKLGIPFGRFLLQYGLLDFGGQYRVLPCIYSISEAATCKQVIQPLHSVWVLQRRPCPLMPLRIWCVRLRLLDPALP